MDLRNEGVGADFGRMTGYPEVDLGCRLVYRISCGLPTIRPESGPMHDELVGSLRTRDRALTGSRCGHTLEAKQLLRVAAGDFDAIRFANGRVIEPVGRLGHVLERVVH